LPELNVSSQDYPFLKSRCTVAGVETHPVFIFSKGRKNHVLLEIHPDIIDFPLIDFKDISTPEICNSIISFNNVRLASCN